MFVIIIIYYFIKNYNFTITKIRHACCEDKRPCSRCLAHGLECQDQVGKKRGRKKKSGEDDNDEDLDDVPTEKPQSSQTSSNAVESSSSTNNNTATTSNAASSSTATATTEKNEKKKKKKKASSPKKKKEKPTATASSSTTTQPKTEPEQVTQGQANQRIPPTQQQMINPNLVNNLPLQLTESELKTPGAMLTAGNVIFPNRDNHPLSLPFLLNQPPEIQQLTQILMRTPVDTFYLHCNNLNSAYDYQNNQSLFGTPYSLHVDEALLHQHQQHMNALNNLKIQNQQHQQQLHQQQLISPGGAASPLIDFTNDEFLRFSPQSPLFASIVEMDENEIHNEVGHMMPISHSNATEEQQADKMRSQNNSNVNNNDDVQIEDCEDTNQKPASSSKQDEEIFEKLIKMSNEEMIKSLQIGDDTKQMIEESIGHLKQFDSNPETANMTYIEYLTQNFPISRKFNFFQFCSY